MSDHHRYYKGDSYGSSSSKRYHSPSEAGRLGALSAADYYDSSDSRSKRSRTDSYGTGTHTSSSRYADYSASSSSSGGSRYKTAASSSSYYDHHQGYKGSTSASSSSSKYLDDYKGSGSSSRSAALKSNVRRVPPPLTPPCLSKSASSLRALQPLMKVSLSSSASAVASSSGKDYYGSRMRQAPPEHHFSYAGTHSSSSTSYSKPEFKRPASYGSSKSMSSTSGYHSTSRSHNVPSYRTSTIASRKLIARSRAPPPSSGVSSRIRGRSTLMSSRRDDDIRRRNMGSSTSTKRDYKQSRSGSRGEERVKTPSKDRKEEETGEKNQEKEQQEEPLDFASIVEGQVVVEEVAGDDEDDDMESSGNPVGGTSSATEKNESTGNDSQEKVEKSVVDESKADGKGSKEKEESKGPVKAEEKPLGPRALLKLHCPYCDVRCISFREFTFHLKSTMHTRTMYNVVSDMKKKLVKVRLEMKDDQRKREKAEKVLSDTSSFCRVCELSFRTDPKEHEANEIHNKIKALIYRRCDVCDIDFRIWKVHIYHLAALEHAKRVAMKELQEGEAKGDNVKGTNLSPEELGLNLLEIRTVFYCNACMRYLPMKGDTDEAKKNHCMTLNHLKNVEEFNERERRRAIREEARERARRRKQEESEKEEASKNNNTNGSAETNKTAASASTDGNETEVKTETENVTKEIGGELGAAQIKQEVETVDENNGDENMMQTETHDNETENTKTTEVNIATAGPERNQNEADEEDDDEIELHAGEDDVEDESEDAGDWSRRTRSSQRGEGSSK